MKYRYCFILNINSGFFREKKNIRFIEVELKKRFPDCLLIKSDSKQTTKVLIADHLQEYDVFVACGGDGTIQTVASQLLHKNKIMGVLPMGSGNDFAKLIHERTKDLASFYETLLTGKPVETDIIKVNNDQYCINTMGIGFDAHANKVAAKSSFNLGIFKYAIAAIITLFNIDKIQLELDINESDKQKLTTYLVVISNGKWEGGSFKISPQSIPNDGYFEILTSKVNSKIYLFKLLLKLLFGEPLNEFEIATISAKKAKLSIGDSIVGHIDGEVVEFQDNVDLEILPAAVKILM